MSYEEEDELASGFRVSDDGEDDDLLGDMPPEDLDFGGLDEEDPDKDS